MSSGLKHFPSEERLRELEERWLWGDLVVAFQYLKWSKREAGEGIFIRECRGRMRGDGFKLKN